MFNARAVFEEVKANLARLDGCPGPHRFAPVERADGVTPRGGLTNEYRCATCQGTVSGHVRHWYERGLAHGRQA